MLLRTFAIALPLLVNAALAESLPSEPRTWYDAAAKKVPDFQGHVSSADGDTPIGDAELCCFLFDVARSVELGDAIEALASNPFDAPIMIRDDTAASGTWQLATLGLMQTTFIPQLGEISTGGADDLLRQLKTQSSDPRDGRGAVMLAWARLGNAEKVISLFPLAGDDWSTEAAEALRAAKAAGKRDAQKVIAAEMLQLARAERNKAKAAWAFSDLILALIDTDQMDDARAALKIIPADRHALIAFEAMIKHDHAREEPAVLEADLKAMVALVEKISPDGKDRVVGCVDAAIVSSQSHDDATAVKCLDAFDRYDADPKSVPADALTVAKLAHAALYTTQRERSDALLAKAVARVKEDDTDEYKQRCEVAFAAVYGIDGNMAEFDRRAAVIDKVVKERSLLFAESDMEQARIDIVRTTRDAKVLNAMIKLASPDQYPQLRAALAIRFQVAGKPEDAWKVVRSIEDNRWRARASIEIAAQRMEILDEAEQKATLEAVDAIENPREAALVLLGVGHRLEGDAGTVADDNLRPGHFD